ncbi:MAG: helix-turn-helix domain-containing protein [Nitrospirae bacterium]|nr:helix-turn-helix domain-containing protein [Nitrospirota bacterium]
MITAKKVYKEIVEMPVKERERLFTVIARQGFEKDLYTHEEVFEDISQASFTIKETSEYLEVAEITVRRWVAEGILQSRRIGKSIVIDVGDIKAFKRNRYTHKKGK